MNEGMATRKACFRQWATSPYEYQMPNNGKGLLLRAGGIKRSLAVFSGHFTLPFFRMILAGLGLLVQLPVAGLAPPGPTEIATDNGPVDPEGSGYKDGE
jgi:hypothetical protein